MSNPASELRAFVDELIQCAANTSSPALDRILLNGKAATELRRLVPLVERRRLGMFFTPENLAMQLAEPLSDVRRPITVLDPSCGAGDLLIAASRLRNDLEPSYATSLVGVDIVPEFIEAANIRLHLLGKIEGAAHLVELEVGEGTDAPARHSATHILMNPPFTREQPPQEFTWAKGKVNSAAIFLMKAIELAESGTVIRAILPDVLRSGSNYKSWRREVDSRSELTTIEPVGQFDRWADVDVFILEALVGPPASGSSDLTTWWPRNAADTVGDHFEVRVGSVVNNRDPKKGPWRPYLTSKEFPTWETLEEVPRNRRFEGRVFDSPFVVVPRTSRPGDSNRARGAIVTDLRPVAVDNHLLCLIPKNGTLGTCESLLDVLNTSATNEWLDSRIRCRHLTVESVASIPWSLT